MSKASFTFEEFQQGTKGQLSESQQIAFDQAYFQDTAHAQAVHAALQFNKLTGDENILLTETRKGEWIKTIKALLLAITLTGVWLLQISNPDGGRELVTIQPGYNSSMALSLDSQNIDHRSPDYATSDNKMNNSNNKRTGLYNAISLKENRNTVIVSTDKCDTNEIVLTQKTNSEQSSFDKEKYEDSTVVSKNMNDLHRRTNSIDLFDATIDSIPGKDTGISNSRSVTEPYAPDPHLIRLLLSSIR